MVPPWPEACRKERLAREEAGRPLPLAGGPPANLTVTLRARKQNENK